MALKSRAAYLVFGLLIVRGFCFEVFASSDSLWNVWINPNLSDTARLHALAGFIEGELLFTDPDSALKMTVVHYNFSKSLHASEHIAKGEVLFGSCYYVKGDYVRATRFAHRALHNYEAILDKTGMANACNLLGNTYAMLEEYDKAVTYYSRSLRLRERIRDYKGMAGSLNNIGLLYSDMADKASNEKKDSLATDYYHRAELFLLKAVKKSRELGFERNLANALLNLGLNHHRRNNFDKALEYYTESLRLKEDAQEYQGVAYLFDNIGLVYADKGDYANAIKYSKMGLDFSKKIGAIHERSEAAKGLSEAYAKSGNFKDALVMFKLHASLRDSIVNDENTRAIMEQQFQFDYDRKEALMRVEREKEQLIAAEKLTRREVQRNAIGVVLGLALLLAGVIFRSYRVKKKDNEFITAQKNEVELKNKDILESISYAKKLQEAAMLPARDIVHYLPDSCLLFMPKDLLSGDFYWMDKKDGKIFLAIGDCTGHGVPGAMLSVMGLNGLNRCLNELQIQSPAAILEQLTDFFRIAFAKSEARVRDGMDVAVCSYDPQSGLLTFSGANIPLWIFRSGQVIVLKPDRRPVGYHDVEASFTEQVVQLQAGDVVYLTTDGYADQMGGEHDKKLKTGIFRTRLAEITGKDMPDQRTVLLSDFEKWKGNRPQTDDVCLLAFRV